MCVCSISFEHWRGKRKRKRNRRQSLKLPGRQDGTIADRLTRARRTLHVQSVMRKFTKRPAKGTAFVTDVVMETVATHSQCCCCSNARSGGRGGGIERRIKSAWRERQRSLSVLRGEWRGTKGRTGRRNH